MKERTTDSALQERASEALGVPVSLVRTEHATDAHAGGIIWERDVSVFAAEDGRWCYAWREHNADTGSDRIYTVLKAGPVRSARDAVRASLLRDYKAGGE